jgi:hypothetical protein
MIKKDYGMTLSWPVNILRKTMKYLISDTSVWDEIQTRASRIHGRGSVYSTTIFWDNP